MIPILRFFPRAQNQQNFMAFLNYIRNVKITINHLLDLLFLLLELINYNLAKYLSSLIAPLLPFSFVEELRSFDFNNKFLISFDVESLFTNIRLNETIDIAVDLIFEHDPQFPIKKSDLKKLSQIVLIRYSRDSFSF